MDTLQKHWDSVGAGLTAVVPLVYSVFDLSGNLAEHQSGYSWLALPISALAAFASVGLFKNKIANDAAIEAEELEVLTKTFE